MSLTSASTASGKNSRSDSLNERRGRIAPRQLHEALKHDVAALRPRRLALFEDLVRLVDDDEAHVHRVRLHRAQPTRAAHVPPTDELVVRLKSHAAIDRAADVDPLVARRIIEGLLDRLA